jgi:hypothetical protein
VQAQLFVVAALEPHRRLAILEDEVDDVVLRPRFMPEREGDAVVVARGQVVPLLLGKVAHCPLEDAVEPCHFLPQELGQGHHRKASS